ncbi:MAG: site-specific integrase [Clostridia bacterium]|nr:site-specific integrase [Clostridia bacterium]
MKNTKIKKTSTRVNRDKGTGTIYQRGPSSWTGYVRYKKDGKNLRKYVSGKSYAEVAKKLSEITGKIQSGCYETICEHTFGELMFEWLMVFKKSSVSPRTFENIIRNFKLHIAPKIGNMKLEEIDSYVVQKIINDMQDREYDNDTIKKIKFSIGQFFDYAIDNKWVNNNPIKKVTVKKYDKNINDSNDYKALTPDTRILFLQKLNENEAGFIKPLSILLLFAGLRSGEVIALKWKNVNFTNHTLKVEHAITLVPKFDENGDVKGRVTVLSTTKTACSVREIPVPDIVMSSLLEWKEHQIKRQMEDIHITGDITSPNAFIFANDDGSVRTYSGTRKIFNKFIKRIGLNNYNIRFHSLRHTFSNMLFEINENPKAIQQLLGHRDVKTTITVYNSVDNEYIRNTTNKLNEKIKETVYLAEQKHREEVIEKEKEETKNKISSLDDDDFDDLLAQLMLERKRRKENKR